MSRYAVACELVARAGAQVQEAARTTASLSARPQQVPAAVARAGSAELRGAAEAFADAWARECAALAHDTHLLGDALVAAAEAYRRTEWAVGAMGSRLLGGALAAGAGALAVGAGAEQEPPR